MKDDPLIGSAEACEILGVDRSTLTRWVARGLVEAAQKLPGENGAYLFRRAEIERAASEQVRAAS
jgi:excisionase family DNA binding protein